MYQDIYRPIPILAVNGLKTPMDKDKNMKVRYWASLRDPAPPRRASPWASALDSGDTGHTG